MSSEILERAAALLEAEHRQAAEASLTIGWPGLCAFSSRTSSLSWT
jgi:hypothetical protein